MIDSDTDTDTDTEGDFLEVIQTAYLLYCGNRWTMTCYKLTFIRNCYWRYSLMDIFVILKSRCFNTKLMTDNSHVDLFMYSLSGP